MKDLKRSSVTMAAYKRKCEDEVAKEQDLDEEDYSLTRGRIQRKKNGRNSMMKKMYYSQTYND